MERSYSETLLGTSNLRSILIQRGSKMEWRSVLAGPNRRSGYDQSFGRAKGQIVMGDVGNEDCSCWPRPSFLMKS